MCNFYYGKESLFLVNSNKSIPLNGNKSISFDHIEIISRTSKKKIPINKIHKLTKSLKKQVKIDLLKIREKKKKFFKFKFYKNSKHNGSIKSNTRQLFWWRKI